jgi:4-hydroxybenzoate polyprenyltransferase
MGRLAAGVPRPQLYFMLTIKGAALIAELIAAALLIIALIGFRVRRTTPWLLCAAIAFAMFMITVVVIVDASST